MDIRVLGCYGGADKTYRLTSFLVNDSFAVDAGALTDALSFEEQRAITDVYISHIHFDHTLGLPFLIDNLFGSKDEPIRIHAHSEILNHLRTHVFNNICWPDFSVLPNPERPTVQYVNVPVGKRTTICGLEVMPIWVNHQVPTAGLIVTDEGKSWVYPSDTRDTEEIWRVTNRLENPRLIFLECSFANEFKQLADESHHLTPNGVAKQLSKLNRITPVRIYHCKPSQIDVIANEIAEIDHPDLAMLEQDKTYRV